MPATRPSASTCRAPATAAGSAADPARLEAAADRDRGRRRVAPRDIRAASVWRSSVSGSAASRPPWPSRADAAIDDLVLWAVPARGRGVVRQLRAFAGLQGSRYSLTGEPEPSLLPDGLARGERVRAVGRDDRRPGGASRLVELPAPRPAARAAARAGRHRRRRGGRRRTSRETASTSWCGRGPAGAR